MVSRCTVGVAYTDLSVFDLFTVICLVCLHALVALPLTYSDLVYTEEIVV